MDAFRRFDHSLLTTNGLWQVLGKETIDVGYVQQGTRDLAFGDDGWCLTLDFQFVTEVCHKLSQWLVLLLLARVFQLSYVPCHKESIRCVTNTSTTTSSSS